jgi:mono/diheme cytochrome c family protein
MVRYSSSPFVQGNFGDFMTARRHWVAAPVLSQCLASLLLGLNWSVPAAADPVDFRKDIQPIFQARCISCHGPETQKHGLRLDIRAAALEGGESGPVIVAGQSTASSLLRRVVSERPGERMPPQGKRLTPGQVALLRAWIDQGAPWPEEAPPARASLKPPGWSLQPLRRPLVPVLGTNEVNWARNPIDAFIRARQRPLGLAPSPEADRLTLLRRLYFDLLGLPPSPAEVQAFLQNHDPLAYEQLVERLLASPRYGERWGRHWLDIVHYGDTHGYDKDKLRPNAWPYRDYVIRALNEDRPYERFVAEQVAGDVLYPGTAAGIVALGFLAAGPWDYVGQAELREGTLDKKITRTLDRDDMVATTLNTFCSLTVQCARCHDHKFDPITQEDYYSLQAVFAGVDRADRPYTAQAGPSKPGLVYAAASHFQPFGTFTPTEAKARPIYLLRRGSETSPIREVGPGTVSCLPGLRCRFPAGAEGERRADLARWLIDRQNPLTWRSIVNRVWHYHFGRGIVDTPNDFGRMGGVPSHPELLDWLAVEIRDGGQSLKRLHRLIVTSATYRQASATCEPFARIDSGNQYLWRMNRQRLDAEEFRDAVLVASGKLSPQMYGPGFRPFGFQDDHSPRYRYEDYDPDDPASHRRSIYRFIVRSVPDPFLESLDCADPSQLVPRRNETLTALQALTLLNDKFMVRMAEHFAGRVASQGPGLSVQLSAAYRLALGRNPRAEEIELLTSFAQQHGLANACRLLLNTSEFSFID